MKVRIKHLPVIGMISGLLMLLALMAMHTGVASAASQINAKSQVSQRPHVPIYKIKLHGAAGISVHGDSSVGTPVVRTNGQTVPLNTSVSEGAYVVVNQNDIQNYSLDVTVPKNFNLDLQVPNGTIQIDGVRGSVTLATENGTIIIKNSTLTGNSKISTKNGHLQFDGKLEPGSSSHFKGENASINVTLPGNTRLHLQARVQQSGNLTGNFNGLPNNAPQSFEGYLNANAGDPGLAKLSLFVVNGSMSVNHN